MAKKYNLVIILLLLIIIGAFINKFLPLMLMKPYVVPPIAVSVVDTVESEWQRSFATIGSLEAINETIISSETDGRVVEVLFESGKQVKKDDLLVKLYNDAEKANLDIAKANYKLALINFNRASKLFENKVVAQNAIDQAQANLDQNLGNVKAAEVALFKKSIKAPFDGIIGINKIKVGQYLAPSTEIASLTDLSKMYLNLTLPEQDKNKIKIGMQVKVKIEAYDKQIIDGVITAIDPQIDLATRNVNFQATLDNQDNFLSPGMFAKADIIVPEKVKLITLPETAIDYSLYGNVVYVIEKKDGKLFANAKYVKVGEKQNNSVSILEGLKQGEQVVADGQLKITNGAEVVISDNPVPKSVIITKH